MTLESDFAGHPFWEVVYAPIANPPVFALLYSHPAVFGLDTVDVQDEVPGREIEAIAANDVDE